MPQDTDEIAEALRMARQAKGLSQRALSQRAGVPQGHISKIEHGTVDLRLSSLVAIARALDLELVLVPRKSVPAVQSVARSSTTESPLHDPAARDALRALAGLIGPPPTGPAQLPDRFAELRGRARALERLPLGPADAAALREVHQRLEEIRIYMDQPKLPTSAALKLAHAALLLDSLFYARARDALGLKLPEPPRPAYSLDDEDDDA